MDAAGERGRGGEARRRVRPARERRVGRRRRAIRTRSSSSVKRGEELVGWRYSGPFDEVGPGAAGRASRDPVGRGHARRRAPASSTSRPAAAARTSSSSKVHGLDGADAGRRGGPLLRRRTAGCTGSRRSRPPTRSSAGSASDGFLVEAGLYEHAYPHCWRCDTPLIFRLSDDWFIAVDELRPQLLEANQDVEWTPAYMGKRMDDWLRNMGDWNISRRRYYGLPLPFYPCECGHLNVIGSKAELVERATGGLDQLEELRRPWIDEVPITCEQCGAEVRRDPRGRRRLARRGHRPLLDARLGEPGVRRRGVRDGCGQGPDEGRPPRPRLLGAVVPGRLGLGDA